MALSYHPNPIVSEDIGLLLGRPLGWERFSGKTVLISGASGFLPSYLVYALLGCNDLHATGIRVVAMVRSGERGRQRFGHYLNRPDFRLWEADVSAAGDPGEPFHMIIHAASQASPRYYGTDPVGTLSANVTGTLNLLRMASASGTERFLYFSSSEVYGSLPPEQVPTRESDYGFIDPTQVRACYAESKRMGETICVSWMHQFGVPAVIVRPFHTYGPGMDLNDGRVYADFIANLVRNEDIKMKSDGSAIRAFCYIRDAAEAFFRVLLDGQPGQAYNVGSPEDETSILGLAHRLLALYPEKALTLHRYEQPAGAYIPSVVSRTVPDNTKISGLGWQPQVRIEEGFKRTISSYL
jgi:UDP-glucuronate decarboxylase